ncbi:MAG: hypothetical protein AAGB12_12300 [Pseudomonadota bacterium]
MDKKNELPVAFMLIVAFLQGVILLFLHQSFNYDYWPHKSPQWFLPLFNIALIWPTLLLLSITIENIKTLLMWVSGYTLFTCLLGYYIGYQGLPIDEVTLNDNLLFPYFVTLAIASFKALLYIQHFLSGKALSYTALFAWSWRNFLTLGLALLMTGGFGLILILWAQLFKAIDIDFYANLFEQANFLYPCLAIVNGIGIVLFRNLSHVIDTITRLQQTLFKFLLIVLAFMSLLFLMALPMAGMNKLWDSGGSYLILWMQALLLFFINAVYQDDVKSRPYSLWLHRFIAFTVILLPIYSVISFYGMYLRVEQYGWSLTRCWGFFIWALLAIFPLGYLQGIIKYKDHWITQLSRINVIMGIVVIVAALLVNSPLLDFRKFVVSSQLARLEDQIITIDELDLNYFQKALARPGYLALLELKQQYEDLDEKIIVSSSRRGVTHEESLEKMNLAQFNQSVQWINTSTLQKDAKKSLINTIYALSCHTDCREGSEENFYLYELDLNNSQESFEYLYIHKKKTLTYFTLYFYEQGNWNSRIVHRRDYKRSFEETDALIERIKSGELQVVKPQWMDFKIGDFYFRVN